MHLRILSVATFALGSVVLAAQDPSPAQAPASAPAPTPGAESDAQPVLKDAPPPNPDEFIVPTGTKVPLSMINSVSTKTAAEGDRIYLETVFPILANGKIVIPPGSWVQGTVTEVKRPGRVKGRGELYVRFDSLTLPNGTTRDFRARLGALDGRATETVDKNEGKIKAEGDKAGDLKTIGEAAGVGAGAGGLGGAVAGHPIKGVGIGAAAGATAGLMYVLLSRGPDAMLAKGTTMDMVLDRPLQFSAAEVDFKNAPPAASHLSDGPGPAPSRKTQSTRRWPY
jgi:type IV secretion system protein VirB10